MSVRDPQEMMGRSTPDDQRVALPIRVWNALKLALWRSRYAWEIVAQRSHEIVGQCYHVPGCPGLQEETSPCLPGCRDRETRMSALVILNAARMFAPVQATRPAAMPYRAPSREYFSEVLAELVALQAENEVLRTALNAANNAAAATPTPNEESAALVPLPAARGFERALAEFGAAEEPPDQDQPQETP